MAEKFYYIGTSGPYFYDDNEVVEAPEGIEVPAGTKQAALLTNGLITALGSASAYVQVANINNPVEVATKAGSAGSLLVAVQKRTGAVDYVTIYMLDETGATTNSPFCLNSATAGMKWIAIAGRYNSQSIYLTQSDALYFGKEGIEGQWRIRIIGPSLVVQVYLGNTWITRTQIDAVDP